MRFRKGARLDTSQVEDYRGQRTGIPGGMPITLGGGGGVIGIIVLLAFLFLGGGGGLGDLGSLAGQTVGPTGQPSGEVAQKIVSRMIIGGSAGLRMMIAFPLRAPPT